MKIPILVLGTSAVSVLVGGMAGFFLAKKQLETKYQELLKTEIEETKKFYSLMTKGPGYESAEEAAHTLGVEPPEERVNVIKAAIALANYKGQGNSREHADVVNIFDRSVTRHEDLTQDELNKRTEEAPFVISVVEFNQNDLEYDQVTFTWFEGDTTLADEEDKPVDDVDMTVGLNNLQRFGDYSGDENIVFVRNSALGIDYEIKRSYGEYRVEVAGFTE